MNALFFEKLNDWFVGSVLLRFKLRLKSEQESYFLAYVLSEAFIEGFNGKVRSPDWFCENMLME